MATEESSVVAAASNAAKIARVKGGFSTTCSEPLMIGQLQLLHVKDVATAAQKIMHHKKQLLMLWRTLRIKSLLILVAVQRTSK